MEKHNSITKFLYFYFLAYQNKEFTQQFWDLASVEPESRAKAIQNILTHLASCKDILNDEKLPNCSTDLVYTVKRLIKGLASSRDAARQGFSAALVFVLLQFPSVETSNVINLYKELLKAQHGSKRQEKKDLYFAQTFSVMILHRSKRIYDGSNTNIECLQYCISTLLEVYKKKSWLYELCLESIGKIIQSIPYQYFVKHVAPSIAVLFTSEISNYKPSVLSLAVIIETYCKNMNKPIPDDLVNIQNGVMKNMTKLIPILVETVKFLPQIHPIWSHIIEYYLSTKAPMKEFFTLWNEITRIFIESSNIEKKRMAFILFEYYLPKIPTNNLKDFFIVDLFNYISGNLNRPNQSLHKQAIENAKSDINRQLEVYHIIINNNGVLYDRKYSTSLLLKLLDGLDYSEISNYIKMVINEIQCPTNITITSKDGTTTKTNSTRTYAIEVLYCVSSNNSLCKIIKENELLNILKIFWGWGMFSIKTNKYVNKLSIEKSKLLLTDVKEPFTAEQSSQCLEKCLALLNVLSNSKRNNNNNSNNNLPGMLSDNTFWISHLIQYYNELISDNSKQLEPIKPLDEENKKLSLDCMKKLEELSNHINKESEKPLVYSLHLLLSNILLQYLYEPEEDISIIDDILLCIDDLLESKTDKSIPVLVDIFINLLGRGSQRLKIAIKEVFKVISDMISIDQLNEIIDTLKLGENGEESKEEEEDDEDDDDNSEDEEKEEEIKFPSVNEIGESDEENEENEEEDKGEDNDMEKEDNEEEEEEEEEKEEINPPGDEKDFEEYDKSFVEALKMKQKENKHKKVIKMNIIHFKLRVLELLSLYSTIQCNNINVIRIIVPLIQSYRQYANISEYSIYTKKVKNVLLKEIFHGKSYPSGESVLKSKDIIHSVFNEVCELMTKIPNVTKIWNESYFEICIESLFYLLKILRKTQNDGEICNDQNVLGLIETERIENSFKPILDLYFTKRNSRIKYKYLTMMVKRQPFFSSLLVVHNCCNYIIEYKFPSLFLFGECIMLLSLVFHYPISFKNNNKLLIEMIKCLDAEIPSLLMSCYNNENEKLKGLSSSKRIRPILELMKNVLLQYDKLKAEPFNLSASWSVVLDKILETPKGKGIKTFISIIRKHIKA